MKKLKAWYKTPAKPRTKGNVALQLLLDHLSYQLQSKRIKDLEQRVEALEGRKVRVNL